MKKTTYVPTLVELLKLDANDVISTSGGSGSGGSSSGGSNNEYKDDDALDWASIDDASYQL